MEALFSKALNVKARYEQWLLGFRNVTGVAVGYKQVRGEYTKQVAIVVYVKQKLPPQQLPPNQIIPHEIDGVPTDVVEATFQALSLPPRTSKIRPAVGGISVGHYLITAGTITNIFYDLETLKLKLVSNNHVIANCAPVGVSSRGDPIYQPGPYDGGTADDTIAYLERWHDLRNYCPIDGAVGDPVSQDQVSINHYDFGEIKPPVAIPKLGDRVQKGGRTTGLTEGTVTAVGATVLVGGYHGREFWFVNQLLILGTGVALGGDSGSLGVLRGTSNPYGVLFAGTLDGSLAVLNPFLPFSILLKVGVPSILDITVKTPDGKPAVGTLVEMPAYNVVLMVDENGRILIGNLEENTKYTINFAHPDYQLKTVEVMPEGLKKSIEVTLETKPPPPKSLGQQLIDVSAPLIATVSTMGVAMTILTPQIKYEFEKLKEVLTK